MSLRTALIRLAYQRPELRPDLVPLLKQAVGKGFFVPFRELPPFLQKILQNEARFKRSDIEVIPAPTASIGLPAFEGNRAYAIAVNLETQQSITLLGDWSGGASTPVDRGGSYTIPTNGAVIVGEYGGRGSFARLYINPNNVSALVSDSSDGNLSEDEKYALTYIKIFNSRGRKDAFRDKGLGTYSTTNPIIQRLANKGLVKIQGRAVRITTNGKNVVQGLSRQYEDTW